MKRIILKKVTSVVIVFVSLAFFLMPANANMEPVTRLVNELTFNPSGPEFNSGKLNPFSVPAIREAMNILIDREYISEQIYDGSFGERWLPFSNYSEFYNFEWYPETVQALENIYAHDFSSAEVIITQEMLDLGATKEGDLWHYADEPVELIFLIRIEDERMQIGDYVSDLLKEIGFLVDRQYKTSEESHPLWLFGDPQDGLWHLYTGQWLTTGEGESENFQFFYTPDSKIVDMLGEPSPLWQAYEPTPEFWALANKLADPDYPWTPEDDVIGSYIQALEWALEDSVRIFLVEEKIDQYFIYLPLITLGN